ncbi:bifunctional folylpolyglutamate synthase/dihydrofolate synthase [Caldisericum sp. AR60]|uniref:bifunctional folylpolyglutamate synthase/dihydrofolate synthase n=1 Tax=Caldisericum sp. AR60 TaxID=3397852 RepID=UPI0039FD6EB2
MRLSECLDEIFALGGKINQPDKYGLANIKRVLLMLGNPENKVPYFHITGTKGKGSTSNYIASILREHGYKTGLYISPSLISTLERISINGKLITPLEFVKYYESLKPIYKNLKNDELPSTFETFTIMAFLYFLSKNVDYGVLEVGLGGRLDATNVIERSVVSIITDISFDHQKYLGNTLKEIAFEKSKIIKKGSPVVFNVKSDEAKAVILEEAQRNNSPYYEFGKDFDVSNIRKFEHYSEFDFISKNPKAVFEGIKIKGIGDYQIIDASLAIQSILVSGINFTTNTVKEGLFKAFWPGRLEVVSKNPLVIIDGAHNDASSQVLKCSLKRSFDTKFVVLFSMLSDKDIRTFLSNIQEITSYLFITTTPNSYSRAMNIEMLYTLARELLPKNQIFIEEDPRRAYFRAKEFASNKLPLLVTGSLYLVGFVRVLENIFTFSRN